MVQRHMTVDLCGLKHLGSVHIVWIKVGIRNCKDVEKLLIKITFTVLPSSFSSSFVTCIKNSFLRPF